MLHRDIPPAVEQSIDPLPACLVTGVAETQGGGVVHRLLRTWDRSVSRVVVVPGMGAIVAPQVNSCLANKERNKAIGYSGSVSGGG